jgi:hypothetical protein
VAPAVFPSFPGGLLFFPPFAPLLTAILQQRLSGELQRLMVAVLERLRGELERGRERRRRLHFFPVVASPSNGKKK